MAEKIIPSAGPSITEKEIQMVAEAVRSGWYENMSLYVDEFERRFSVYTGMRYCLATNNCTAAIHLALCGLGIGPGDEVIIPDITWVASASPVCYVGATPVFADIDGTSWCLSAESFERAITKKTKAVVVVGLYGNMPDMDAIRVVAEQHNIPIIEDAAESIGAVYKGKKAGTCGTVGVYSFNGTKLIVTGEGGMIVTEDEMLYHRFKCLSNHGMVRKPGEKLFWSQELGYKYKLTNLQAALGLAQLSRIDELVEQRRNLFRWYQERLSGIEGLQLNSEAYGVKSTFWVVTMIVDKQYGLKKEELLSELQRHNIGCRPFFYPLSSMPPFAPYCSGQNMAVTNPVAYGISPYGISLPSAASMAESEVDHVCETFQKILLRTRSLESLTK